MIEIKKYTDHYRKQYCYLYIETWKTEPYGELFTINEARESTIINNNFMYLLVDNSLDEIIGFVGGRPISHECSFFTFESDLNIPVDFTFYIDELGVAESHKRHGWGQTLMLFIMGCAREKGFKHFVLRTHSSETNPALKLYENLGFVQMKKADGGIYGVFTEQLRFDDRTTKDFRIYYYKNVAVSKNLRKING